MKIKFFYIILFLFNLLTCLDSKGGIKLRVTEELAYNSLDTNLISINAGINLISLDQSEFFKNKLRTVILSLENINKNMISIKFYKDKINIKITGLTGQIRYRKKSLIFFSKSSKINLNKFDLEADVKIFSKIEANGRLVLDGAFTNGPTLTMNNLYNDLKPVIGGNENLEFIFRKNIKNAIVAKCTDILNSFFGLFPKNEVALDSKRGIYADYSLVSPIVMNNGYFDIISYRRIYNKNIVKTQDKEKYISTLPENINPGKQFKLYISKANIASCIESFLANSTKFRLDTYIDQSKFDINLLKKILKYNFHDYDGKSKLKILFSLYRHMKIEIEDNALYAVFDAIFNIYFDYQSEQSIPAYSSFLYFKAKINILFGININPSISDLSYEVGVNNGINSPPSKEEVEALLQLKNSLFPIVNEIYKSNIIYKSPIVDGINFSKASLEYNKDYLVINYSY